MSGPALTHPTLTTPPAVLRPTTEEATMTTDTEPQPTGVTTTTAVAYIRVSTKDQAERGGQAEGFSIPAQREAIRRKAESMSAVIVAEFTDAGESAKSADRPELQRMLSYLTANPVSYVLVHKVDRLARNRADDIEISMAIRNAGATLVSVTENIDETPSGYLMHGIMSSIAEFYSRNLAQEVIKGLSQKVSTGGTISRAPIGYLNVRDMLNGREHRYVKLDPVRAEHVRWAFEMYATGEWSLSSLAQALEERGLTQRATPKQVDNPVRRNKLQTILRNRYYLGFVTWRGVEYDGNHEPIIDAETFDRVQTTLESHNQTGMHQRKHLNYLTGTLHCARCRSRLLYMLVKGNGGSYEYFVCTGRHTGRTNCDLPYVPLYKVEAEVAKLWHDEQAMWEADGIVQIEQGLLQQLQAAQVSADRDRTLIERHIDKINRERYKWADKAMDGAVPADIAREKQQQLARQLAALQDQQAQVSRANASQEEILTGTIRLIANCGEVYNNAGNNLRRIYNQAWFNRITVDAEYEDTSCSPERTELMETLHRSAHALYETHGPAGPADSTHKHEKRAESLCSRLVPHDYGSTGSPLVELRGLEPLTPSLRTRCATSCATAPWCGRNFNTAARPVRNDHDVMRP